jgi:methylenetetrahydrofolate reductase (NADPH)
VTVPHKSGHNRVVDKLGIQNLVNGYSIETTVREAVRVERFSDMVPLGTRLYAVHVPGTTFAETVELAARLRKEGLEPVPHIVARRIASLAVLEDFLARLAGDAGVRQALLVAGDLAQPVGQIENTLQILDSGLLEKYGVRTVGVAGHPEGHRDVTDAALRDALRRKNGYAQNSGADVYIVTQFTFAAEPIIAWERSFGGDIGELPFRAGLPGLASVRTLLKFAADCGVGVSLQAFSKRAASLTRLVTVSTPDTTIVGLARYKEHNPKTRLTGVHFFPFGGFKRTAEWANKIAAGDFDVTEDGLRV